jgi:hypothetical protein
VDELAATPDGSGPELARFSPDVIVRLTVPGDYLSTTERAGAGRQLANNVRLHTNDQVKEAMRAGQVDLRTMTVLAQLCRDHEVSVTSTGKPVAEQGTTLPDRMITVSTIDGRPAGDDLVDWLQAQQPPYAPAEVRLTDDGAVIGWRLPALHDPATN